jgi:hypothetical protein
VHILPDPHSSDTLKVLPSPHDCPKCGFPMLLAIIEPADEAGTDKRTFECLICKYVETAVVKFR